MCDRAHEKYTSGWNLTKHEVSTTKAGQIQILMLIPILILVQVPHTLTSIFIGCRLLDCRLFYIHSQLGANTITMLHADNDIYMADDLYSRTEFAASAEEVFVCGFSPIRHEPASPSCTRSGVRADSGSDADDFASYLQAAASPVPRATNTPQCCALSPASPFTSAAQASSVCFGDPAPIAANCTGPIATAQPASDLQVGSQVIYIPTGDIVTVAEVYTDDPGGEYYGVKMLNGNIRDAFPGKLGAYSGTNTCFMAGHAPHKGRPEKGPRADVMCDPNFIVDTVITKNRQCKHGCFHRDDQFESALVLEGVQRLRKHFMGERHLRQALLDWLNEHALVGTSDEAKKRKANYVLPGFQEPVCQACWICAAGFEDSSGRRTATFERALAAFNRHEINIKCVEMAGKQKSKHKSKRVKERVIAWVTNWLPGNHDKSPMDPDVMHLNASSKGAVWVLCCLDFIREAGLENATKEEQNAVSPSKAYFLKLLRKNFKAVIHKHKKFAQCSMCAHFKELSKKAQTIEEREWIGEHSQTHYDQQYDERVSYYARRGLAVKYPRQYMSIIVDCATSWLTSLPAFWRSMKSMPSFEAFDSQILGVLVHGAEGFFGYLVDGGCKSGSNATVEGIRRTFMKLAGNEERRQHWPPVCFIQLDGCVGDNKNRTVFGYCAWLVAQGHFQRVEVSFLMVGHTHEDIDAIFGVISKFFKRMHTAITTLQDLIGQIWSALTSGGSAAPAGCTPTSPVEHMQSTYDWSSFLIGEDDDPNMQEFAKYARQVPDTHRPHHFVFEMLGGEVKMNYKHFCESDHSDNTLNPGWWNLHPIKIFRRVPPLHSLQPNKLREDVVSALENCDSVARSNNGGCGVDGCGVCSQGLPHGCGETKDCPRCGVFSLFEVTPNWPARTMFSPTDVSKWVERFRNVNQEHTNGKLPLLMPLPKVGSPQARLAGFTMPEVLLPAPNSLPPPVTYNGYSERMWREEMSKRGLGAMLLYKKKKKKKRGESKDDGAQAECDQDAPSNVHQVVGVLRNLKNNKVEVAVVWEDEDGARLPGGTWVPLSNLNNCTPGTDGFQQSFGQGREGDEVVVAWASGSRYVAKCHTFNNTNDTMTMKYPKQSSNTELKTSVTDVDKDNMRLDTMATSKRHPTTKSQVHHHWWVQRTYASENWIATKVKVQMIDQPAKPTAKTKKRKSTIKKGSSSDSSPNSTPNQSSSQNSEPCEESPAPITSTQPSGRQLRSRRRLAH